MIRHFIYLLIPFFIFYGILDMPVYAQDDGVRPTQTNPELYSAIQTWMQGRHLTGEWHGLREGLTKRGIDLNVSYTNDFLGKMYGGISNKSALRPVSLLNFSVTVDTSKYRLPGGKLYILGQNVHGVGPTQSTVGSLQTISNIEAQPLTQLGEFWYEQRLLKDKLRTKIGKQDANTEFGLLPANTNFVNNSFLIMPNVLVPSYPNQSFGGELFLYPVKWFNVKAGFFGGNPNDKGVGIETFFAGRFTTLVETEVEPSMKGLPGKYIAGYWFSTAQTQGVGSESNMTFSSNTGFYTAFQQMIYKKVKKDKNKDDDDRGLSIQGQFAWAPSYRNAIAQYYGACMTYKGGLPHRDQDYAGIGTAIAALSDQQSPKNETILELFYKAQITPFFAIEPDMQFVFNPGGVHQNAFVMGFRTVVSF